MFTCGRTYAAAHKVDFLSAVDPNIKPAAVGHQETCWTNEDAEGEWCITLQMYSLPSFIPPRLRNRAAILHFLRFF